MKQREDEYAPWHPMNDPVDLKHMGKLIEECGELAAIAARCMIQGVDGSDPDSGKPNRQALMEEIADVIANIKLCSKRFDIYQEHVEERVENKMRRLAAWHRMA